jgi:hypothetical protein
MTLRVLIYCVVGGLVPTIAAFSQGHFGWWWLAGIVLAAAFVPVAQLGPARPLAQFGLIATVLMIVAVFCTWTEALVFVPRPEIREHAWQNLFGSAFLYLLVAVVLALLGRVLALSRANDERVETRSIPSAASMVFVCGLAYATYYLIFGAITFEFFTKQYYPDALQLVEKLGVWFWPMQFGRGVLMTLAVVPVIYTLRMKRWHAAVLVGLILWVAGGLSLLIPPSPIMGPRQRIIHIVEIFTQNFSLGVTAALLLRPNALLQAARATPQDAVHA